MDSASLIEDRLRDYCRYFETLTPASVDSLDAMTAAEVHFRDPFNDARGREAFKQVFRRMFAEVDDPRFTVTRTARDGEACFLRWHFTCRPRLLGRGLPWVIDGVSEVVFDAQGLVREHIDYWDAGRAVYERLPVLCSVLRFVRRRYQAS